ncbi:MAG: murein L,D-transpeptidase YafK [Hyphomicrobiaceae bacterium]|jgi:murein L,D-transpeptidase YafK
MQLLRFAKPIMVSALASLALTACAKVEIAAPHMAPLPKDARMLLGRKHMTEKSPIFLRIFKAESELEVWKQRPDGHFYHFKTYPICNWSGGLGPKLRQGDKQSPEGFYKVNRHQMNPNSKFHLSFDLGFPNAYDRAHGRTGNFLMVHGKCRSAGCYAMTDGLIEEIYALAREAFSGGQKAFQVHAFPFRLTQENLARYQGDRNTHFWRSLKAGYDHFEVTRQVPNVEICNRRYHVNVEWNGRRKLNPRGQCPRFRSGPIVPFVAQPGTANERIKASGPAASPNWSPAPQPAATRSQQASVGQTRYYSGNRRMSLTPPRPRPASIADLLQK